MSLMAVAEYYGMQSPAPYNSVDINKYKEKMPAYSQKSKLIRFKPLVKNDKPSPVTYNPKDVITRERAAITAFPKDRVKNFLEQHVKAKSFLPSPNSYNIDKAHNYITLGARSSYR
jgi:hypothetical protein